MKSAGTREEEEANGNFRKGKEESGCGSEAKEKRKSGKEGTAFEDNSERVAMESETALSTDEQQAADTRGKHRILAELKLVEQESKSLEEEMEELEQTDSISTLCEELLRSMETRPDPLLPLTNGPINPLWDRWFEGPQDSQGCRCEIL
ncbi:hypothetical protein PTKIN_Ptkin15bG0109700 [Pterospermum kingtungense]